MTTAQRIGACTPRTQNASPPSAPCAAATRTLPLTVARITVVKRASRRALAGDESGIASRTPRATSTPSRSRKNSRYIAMTKATMTSSTSWPISSTRPASAWPRCVIAAVTFACSAARSSMPSQPSRPVAHDGSAATNLREVGADVDLSGLDAVVHAGHLLHQRDGDQRDRQDDDDEDDRERRQRGEVASARHPREEPAIERLEQQREHGAPEDAAVERPDDPRERDRQDDQQDQECVCGRSQRAPRPDPVVSWQAERGSARLRAQHRIAAAPLSPVHRPSVSRPMRASALLCRCAPALSRPPPSRPASPFASPPA